MDSSSAAADLAAANNATLGPESTAAFPVIKMKDGSSVPTGTIGALLVNIKAYDQAYAANDTNKMKDLEQKMVAAVPLLKKIGFFDLFSAEEWEAGANKGKHGRAFVGKTARE